MPDATEAKAVMMLYLRFWLARCSACGQWRPICRFPRLWATSGCHLTWGLDE